MSIRLIIIYLTIFFLVIGLFLHWQNLSDANKNFINGKDLLLRKDSATILLQQENITVLSTNDSALYINHDKLLFTTDTVLGKAIYVPLKRNVWEGYLKLWFANDVKDSLKSKVLSIQKVKEFCKISNPQIADSLVFDSFVRQLQYNQKANINTFIINNEIISQRIRTLALSDKETLKLTIDKRSNNGLMGFLSLFFLLLSALIPLLYLGFYPQKNKPQPLLNEIKEAVNKPEIDPQQDESEIEHLDNDEVMQIQKFKSEKAQTQLYMDKFYEQYHDFYDNIQKLPNQPTEADKQQIKRKIVEMGLHAHTWMMVYKLQKMDRLQGEPNVALMMNDGKIEMVDKHIYNNFTTDPYNTPQRIRFLKKIIEEIDIGDSLNAFLNNVYVSKEYW
jgi:hypothetical protein